MELQVGWFVLGKVKFGARHVTSGVSNFKTTTLLEEEAIFSCSFQALGWI
jgi:hypothetical protein